MFDDRDLIDGWAPLLSGGLDVCYRLGRRLVERTSLLEGNLCVRGTLGGCTPWLVFSTRQSPSGLEYRTWSWQFPNFVPKGGGLRA